MKCTGTIHVHGKRIEQMVVMTDFYSEGGIRRFRDILDRIGLKKAIQREKDSEDVKVYIGEVRVDEYL